MKTALTPAGARAGKFLSLALAVVSLALLVPGVTLPVLSLKGTIHKAEAFQTSKDVIVEGMVTRARADAETRGTPLSDQDAERTRLGAVASIETVLGMIGLKSESIEGTIEVYDEERSILGAVRELFQSGYGFVALLIVTFSVVVPVVKTALLAGHLMSGNAAMKSAADAIGKWSMADVFAIAIIVSCLAADSYKFRGLLQMDASLEAGFYFFVAYCLMSLLGSRIRWN